MPDCWGGWRIVNRIAWNGSVAARAACVAAASVLLCVVIGACAPTGDTEPPRTVAATAIVPLANVAPATTDRPAEEPIAADPITATATSPPPIEALPQQTAACFARQAQSGSRSLLVHRWTDAAGIVHYSDQPAPASAKGQRVIEVKAIGPIVLNASGHDVNLPDDLQRRAIADAAGVQRVMRDALGVSAPADLTLRLVFVRAADAYASLIGDPTLAASAGAYSTARQTIYVRMQAGPEQSFAVLRHEIVHALIHESVGNLPTALNEGMAEYFGRFHANGMGGQVDVGADRAALIAAAPAEAASSDALVDLLAHDGGNFYAETVGVSTREQRYLRAYALIALLMRDAPGRSALAAVLASQRADPCRPVAAERVLAQRYPGGLVALVAAWTAFMKAPPAVVDAF